MTKAIKVPCSSGPGKPHSWGEWLGYDQYPFEMGITNGFRYHRQCLMSGCEAQQRVEDLVPSGKMETRKALLATPPKD